MRIKKEIVCIVELWPIYCTNFSNKILRELPPLLKGLYGTLVELFCICDIYWRPGFPSIISNFSFLFTVLCPHVYGFAIYTLFKSLPWTLKLLPCLSSRWTVHFVGIILSQVCKIKSQVLRNTTWLCLSVSFLYLSTFTV